MVQGSWEKGKGEGEGRSELKTDSSCYPAEDQRLSQPVMGPILS